MLPVFYALTDAVNPNLARAQVDVPVVVVADPAQCSVQFDLVGQAVFSSPCDIARSTVTGLGVSYTNEEGPAGSAALIRIGELSFSTVDGRGLSTDALAAVQSEFETRLRLALNSAGYPTEINSDDINVPRIIGLLVLLVIFSVMVYAPMPTMALEMFPTRIRYSALSLPYHIGSGWFGGFLPVTAFAIIAATGNMYAGLAYPLVITIIGILVLAFLLPETKDRDIQRLD
jgi:hypothetical protein